jgi:monomeric isocitrate dehydrogenase
MSYFLFTWKRRWWKYQIQLFWAIVEVYFATVFEKYAVLFNELNIDTRNGLGDVYAKIAGHLCKLKWKQH